MSSDSNRLDVESLLAAIRQGKREQLGELLELYRNYLLILARTQIDLHLRGRLSAADVVQESYLEACRDFGQFRGNTGAELLTWLRRILIHNLASAVEQHIKTQKRDARREVPIRSYLDCLEQSSDSGSSSPYALASCVRPNCCHPTHSSWRRRYLA